MFGNSNHMNWFSNIMGFSENQGIRAQLQFNAKDGILYSKPNKTFFQCGKFETPSLEELRKSINLSSHAIQ